MAKITLIGGGSSTFTPVLIRAFIESEVLSGSTISLMDVDPHRLEVMDSLSRRLVEHMHADLKIESTTDQRESLVDADFVIAAIAVGGHDAHEKDIEIPAKYGVYMHIADSIGPGGIMRAFRHVPVLVEVCKNLEEVSPEAWVFNYTNPLTANVMAMNKRSKIRTVGLCTCSHYPRNGEYLGNLVGVLPEKLSLPAPAGGLNHCAAILELRLRDGRDAFPMLRERVEDPIQRIFLENHNILPYCTGHWIEFFPNLTRLEEEYRGKLQGLKMKYGRRVHDMEERRAKVKKWETLAEELSQRDIGDEDLSSLPEGEGVEVVQIVEALMENQNAVHVINVPNKGAISNLPDDAIVEVSSLVGGYGVQPLHVGKLPDPIAAALWNYVAAQNLTAEAAMTGDRETALKAFLQDPQISSRLTPEETLKMLDELLSAHHECLPRFK